MAEVLPNESPFYCCILSQIGLFPGETKMSHEKGEELPTPRATARLTEGTKRLDYSRPQLRFYGNVADLTASGSPVGNESLEMPNAMP
jgi:hypothetical protein